MRIDLHCHTKGYSSCSSLGAEELIERARAAGLDGVCLTEHDRLWPETEIERLRARTGFGVLRGMEVTTELGHVLVVGLLAPPGGMFFAATLVEAVRAAGGLAALAHPARPGQPRVAQEQVAALFDLVETLNGSDGDAPNGAAAALARATDLPGIAGSDCHSPGEVGTVCTVLPHAVSSEAELIAALRLGRHHVERLRHTAEHE